MTDFYDASYSYDEVGNRLTKIEGGVITTSAYGVANELSVENAGGTLTTYSYDANTQDGKRRRYQDNTGALPRNFIRDGENALLQIDANNITGRDCAQSLWVRGEPVGHCPGPAADHQD